MTSRNSPRPASDAPPPLPASPPPLPASPSPEPVALDLTGRTALVTGAAGGIGRACALRLARAGAEVRAVDRDEAGLDALAAELKPLAPVVTHVLDLSADEGLEAAEHAAAGSDVLVNNAGRQLVRPVEEFPPADFRGILTLMLEAPFRLTRGALPGMYERGWGRVVNISSVHGLRASAYKSAYVAAKHGLEGFSKVTALEGAAHGVTSNCVSPAYVRTPLVERQIADQAAVHGISPERVVSEILLAESALKRLLEPEEVAESVAYLCTPHASFITGTSISLDGGWTAS
jgi:3-hydroxybutyrate dehydrogenase